MDHFNQTTHLRRIKSGDSPLSKFWFDPLLCGARPARSRLGNWVKCASSSSCVVRFYRTEDLCEPFKFFSLPRM